MSWFLAPVTFGGWLLVLVCYLRIKRLRVQLAEALEEGEDGS